jgi:hypothetical protein
VRSGPAPVQNPSWWYPLVGFVASTHPQHSPPVPRAGQHDASGEGSIYRLADPRWRGSIFLGYRDGKPHRKYVTRRTRAAVATDLRRLLEAHRQGQLVTTGSMTMGEWLAVYVEQVARLEPRTRGLREGCYGAASALPARTPQEYARKARNAQGCDRWSFHEPFHDVLALPGDLPSPNVTDRWGATGRQSNRCLGSVCQRPWPDGRAGPSGPAVARRGSWCFWLIGKSTNLIVSWTSK